MNRRLVFAAAVIVTLANKPETEAPLAPGQVSGWWRGTVTHNGESDNIYLQFEDRAGVGHVSFTIPSVGTDHTGIGRYQLTSSQVQLTDLKWSLERNSDGSIHGVIPDQLIPVYKIDVIFRRSSAPTLESPARPAHAAPRPLWRAHLTAPVLGGVVGAPKEGLVLVATTAGQVTALSAVTGQSLWSADVGAPVRSAPLVAGRNIFVSADTKVVKLDVETGRQLWTSALGAPLKPILPMTSPDSQWDHYSASPVLSSGQLYVASRDGCIRILQAADGELLRSECRKTELTGRPVVDGDRIYSAGYDGIVRAVGRSTGAPLWEYDTHGAVPRDLVLVGNTIIAGSRSYDLVAINKNSGKKAWTKYSWWGWIDAEPDVKGSDILIGSSDAQRLYRISGNTGKSVWTTYLGGWTWPKPARGKATVYAGVIGTTMSYVGKRDGGLAALDLRTGRLKWMFKTDHRPDDLIFGFPAAPLVAGGRVYAVDQSGSVFAFMDQ